MRSTIYQASFISILMTGVTSLITVAQTPPIIPDETLPNNSVVDTEGMIHEITEGATVGTNLFHSFREFSLPPGNTAFFNNAVNIENIITRVTGGKLSNIEGIIKANGETNLFLINPNGIIFGRDAKLDIGGSFLGSTAESILFEDGTVFSASQLQQNPLLTISVPRGVQFGNNPGQIVNRSQTTQIFEDDDGNQTEVFVGLQVKPGKTLALIGGEINIEGGKLFSAAGIIDLADIGAGGGNEDPDLGVDSPGGKIHLGAVGANNTVLFFSSLENPDLFQFDYELVDSFQDIQFSNLAVIDASGNGGGEIELQGKQIILTEGTQIQSNSFGDEPGATIFIKASESLQLQGNTLTEVVDPRFAAAGLIIPLSTRISTTAFASGEAGNIVIDTAKIIVNLGSKIEAFSFGSGSGGDIFIKASESIAIYRDAILLDYDPRLFVPFGFDVPGFDAPAFRSLAIASSIASVGVGVGDAGNITIETGKLILSEGGKIATDPLFFGDGGSLSITASELIEVSGTSELEIPSVISPSPSFISAASAGTGNANTITLNTKNLIVRDGGVIQVGTFSTGNGGDLLINASESIKVSGFRLLSNNDLILSTIRASSFGSGNAGNLVINGDRILVENEGEIAVNRSEMGIAGNMSITANILDLNNGLITATSLSGQGGNINLEIGKQINLINNSQISTRAGIASGNGNGGNILIDTPFILAFPSEINQITANAFEGNGGNINITTNAIFGTQFLAINASSQLGIDGIVIINSPYLDTNSGLIDLSVQAKEKDQEIVTACSAEQGNKFVIKGKGGLASNPIQPIFDDLIWEDARNFDSLSENKSSNSNLNPVKVIPTDNNNPPESMTQARGWIINKDGSIILTANSNELATPNPRSTCTQEKDA